jgi:inner membrane protein
VQTEDAYLLGNYSFFDSQPITFESYPKNHDLLGNLAEDASVKRMITITEGWYTISEKNDTLYFNDLRFGLLSLKPKSDSFVFKYRLDVDASGKVIFTEEPKDNSDGKKLLSELWQRLKGN